MTVMMNMQQLMMGIDAYASKNCVVVKMNVLMGVLLKIPSRGEVFASCGVSEC
jgi:hypothetical protein